MSGIGAPADLRPTTFRSEVRKAIPPSGDVPETIWHAHFDTKTYPAAGTGRLNFFDNVNVGNRFLSNQELGGMFPAPQVFTIYGITLDFYPANPITSNAALAGAANDAFLLLLAAEPVWTLTLQSKRYGPYPLSVLRASGGPEAWLQATTAAGGSVQLARNVLHGGWDYRGQLTIPSNVGYSFTIEWNTAVALNQAHSLRVTMFGKLLRAVK
jgi:hypothetical protein